MNQPLDPEQQRVADLKRGEAAADAWWDANRHDMSVHFFLAFICKLMAAMSVAFSRLEVIKVWTGCERVVRSLKINRGGPH